MANLFYLLAAVFFSHLTSVISLSGASVPSPSPSPKPTILEVVGLGTIVCLVIAALSACMVFTWKICTPWAFRPLLGLVSMLPLFTIAFYVMVNTSVFVALLKRLKENIHPKVWIGYQYFIIALGCIFVIHLVCYCIRHWGTLWTKFKGFMSKVWSEIVADEDITTGAAGAAGPEGPRGPEGLRGPEGPEGPEGPRGPEGFRGPEGLRGPEGREGPVGHAGPFQTSGPSRSAGPPRHIGNTGLTGPPGWA